MRPTNCLRNCPVLRGVEIGRVSNSCNCGVSRAWCWGGGQRAGSVGGFDLARFADLVLVQHVSGACRATLPVRALPRENLAGAIRCTCNFAAPRVGSTGTRHWLQPSGGGPFPALRFGMFAPPTACPVSTDLDCLQAPRRSARLCPGQVPLPHGRGGAGFDLRRQ